MYSQLPKDYFDRPVSLDDAQAVAELCNAESQKRLGVEKYTVDLYRREWSIPGFKPEEDARVVVSPDGQLAGYYEVWDAHHPHTQPVVWGRTHPEHTGKGIACYLLGWAEQRAHQAICKAPSDARVTVLGYARSLDTDVEQLFLEHGYQTIRYSLTMVVEFDTSPAEPIFPPGICVRQMNPETEMRAVFTAGREAFRDHWGYVERPIEEEYRTWHYNWIHHPEFDPSMWFVAFDGDEIVGSSACMPHNWDNHDMGWVASLSVRRPWRKRGIGMALLQHSFVEFYRRGICKVGLGVDAENLSGALRLYEKAGMHSEPSRQYSQYEKELRPGVDYRTK